MMPDAAHLPVTPPGTAGDLEGTPGGAAAVTREKAPRGWSIDSYTSSLHWGGGVHRASLGGHLGPHSQRKLRVRSCGTISALESQFLLGK